MEKKYKISIKHGDEPTTYKIIWLTKEELREYVMYYQAQLATVKVKEL